MLSGALCHVTFLFVLFLLLGPLPGQGRPYRTYSLKCLQFCAVCLEVNKLRPRSPTLPPFSVGMHTSQHMHEYIRCTNINTTRVHYLRAASYSHRGHRERHCATTGRRTTWTNGWSTWVASEIGTIWCYTWKEPHSCKCRSVNSHSCECHAPHPPALFFFKKTQNIKDGFRRDGAPSDSDMFHAVIQLLVYVGNLRTKAPKTLKEELYLPYTILPGQTATVIFFSGSNIPTSRLLDTQASSQSRIPA